MTKEDLAKKLDGKEYRQEISEEILKEAKDNGLVIVYGHSDDLMELEGALDDEGSCYEGEEFLIDNEGLLPSRDDIDDDDELEKYFLRKKKARKLEALWCTPHPENEPAWTYATKIPHATFNVMEDGEVQCRGIVFELSALD